MTRREREDSTTKGDGIYQKTTRCRNSRSALLYYLCTLGTTSTGGSTILNAFRHSAHSTRILGSDFGGSLANSYKSKGKRIV